MFVFLITLVFPVHLKVKPFLLFFRDTIHKMSKYLPDLNLKCCSSKCLNRRTKTKMLQLIQHLYTICNSSIYQNHTVNLKWEIVNLNTEVIIPTIGVSHLTLGQSNVGTLSLSQTMRFFKNSNHITGKTSFGALV